MGWIGGIFFFIIEIVLECLMVNRNNLHFLTNEIWL